ncbi:MAG: hypothetical protein KGI69_02920 [Patescibacteria group bacterium]|nr:hypothetical protein [Patescibacteria group bacterium]
MSPIAIFAWIYCAMAAHAVWESSAEGRSAGYHGKHGWRISVGWFSLTRYHFWLFAVMYPILLTLPLAIYGWDIRVLGIISSAFFSGLIVEDFLWYAVNPVVKLRELWSPFSDYYSWVRIAGHKVIPAGYVLNLAIAVAIWWFVWR